MSDGNYGQPERSETNLYITPTRSQFQLLSMNANRNTPQLTTNEVYQGDYVFTSHRYVFDDNFQMRLNYPCRT